MTVITKLKLVFLCLFVVGKAFLVASVVVFGGGVVAFRLAASKLEISTVSDTSLIQFCAFLA